MQNQGEEISLRLRTDDLKGFRKYEVIKKTLIHELVGLLVGFQILFQLSLDVQLNDHHCNVNMLGTHGAL